MPALNTDRSNPATVDTLRVPPHSIEAEQAVLGGTMLVADAWDKIADRLTADDFYRKDHRLIFQAMSELVARNQPCDVLTIGEWFQHNDKTDEIGGSAYLVELAENTPGAANIRAYADIVREKSILRQLIDAGIGTAEDAYHPDGRHSRDLLEAAERRVFAIAETGARGRKNYTSMPDTAREVLRILHERYENRGQLTGLSTGFADLDRWTSGLQGSDLVIVAARPSMGKTALALNIAEHAALSDKQSVLFFSMEMSATQLGFRLVSAIGRINQTHLRNGDIAEEDWPRVTQAMGLLGQAKIFIDDTAALAPNEIRARARRIQREHGLGLIVIDYLQLMQVPGNKENRATEISEISRGLKALAKELDIPVVALSQLNRSLEQRTDKRPMLADLRESGAIEQDADVILFIYRDEYYHKESADKGLAEIIIGKQRNGPTGTFKLAFLGCYTKFENYAPERYEGSFE